jgi:hypothetical protein
MTKSLDLVDQVAKYKAELFQFYLDFDQWKTFKSRHSLNWQKTRFDATKPSDIPNERGVYAFTLEMLPTKLPTHGYIMYVGITGDQSPATLRSRYSQYLREMHQAKRRPKVRHMLRKWHKDLFFNFAPLPGNNVDLAKLETAILNAVQPPINERDMSADIMSVRKAAF